jgi:acetolactate synthase-1/2/3 large subunit
LETRIPYAPAISPTLGRTRCLPTAMAAKLEFPRRDVVALAGDDALLMTIGDLPTAMEYGANILIVVANDGAFGQTQSLDQHLR